VLEADQAGNMMSIKAVAWTSYGTDTDLTVTLTLHLPLCQAVVECVEIPELPEKLVKDMGETMYRAVLLEMIESVSGDEGSISGLAAALGLCLWVVLPRALQLVMQPWPSSFQCHSP